MRNKLLRKNWVSRNKTAKEDDSMEQQTQQTIDLIKQSDSTILIAIGVLVLLLILSIPVINTIAKIRREFRQDTHNREDMLIKVVQENTAVNASLKTLIQEDKKVCDDCRRQQIGMFRELQDNQDVANMKLVEIHTILKKEDK